MNSRARDLLPGVKVRECGEVRSNVEQGWKKKACWYLVHLIFPAALGGGSGRSWVVQSCKAGNTRPRGASAELSRS